VAADLRSRLGDHVRVSSGKTQLYPYADDPDAARQAELVAQDVLAQHQVSADCRLEYWDLLGEAWRDAATGRLGLGTGPQAAREYRRDRRRQKSFITRQAGWYVRVKMPTHDDMKALPATRNRAGR
jgi:hypothetical protein